MLLTRCPDCDTTFRVTDDALKKANGQVRCGRCASVFNAYAEACDVPGGTAQPTGDAAARTEAAHAAPAPVASEPGAASPPPPSPVEPQQVTPPHLAAPNAPASAATSTAAPPPASTLAPTAALLTGAESAPSAADARAAERPFAVEEFRKPPSDDTFESMSVADVVAQVEIGADDGEDIGELAATASDSSGMSPQQVEDVLASEDSPTGTWPPLADEPRRHTRAWAAGVALATLALAAQSVHHFRSDLAANPSFGPIVQRAYTLLGAQVTPSWDIRQYEILDWIATAEPTARGQGSLRITARIKNRGPQYQPYPSVHLRLKDRWEEAVGSRVFAPSEYLAAAPRKLMAPGETTRAEIAVVDPGQDAYGFELDVCIEIETRVLSCGSDKVFL